jgi:ubiquinone/menaquinone biosynthesis C-methylase UbiE
MNYDLVAEAFARRRGASQLVVDELVRHCQIGPTTRVLEIGCGTAAQLARLVEVTGCTGWGVEPSVEMRRRAAHGPRLAVHAGSAEQLPFPNDSFDLAFSVNVIHHVADRAANCAEAFRVLRPGGLLCTVTDSPEMIRRRIPLTSYWPASAAGDLLRYPTLETLIDLMAAAGFVDIACRELQAPFLVTDAAPYREKAFSCLHLVPEEEFRSGLESLESDLRAGTITGLEEHACLWGKRPLPLLPPAGLTS